ncbi:alkaline phosphatase family protein [Gammaproteobacteria bacterium]|nr:alkaline phosphatase family protein [Gammaproteobacteria bacterium]MDA8957343.1 alkaline phosphatase family protein [Gammaproteobacteria bacterium]
MKATVLILLDAFRNDYLDKDVTPFLYSCAKNGHHVKKVIPSFGFCERAEILSGKNPAQSGYFTAIGYDPSRSPYKNFSAILNFFSYIEKIFKITFIAKAIRKVIKIFVKFHSHSMKPYMIPLNMLDNFSLTEDYFDHRDPRAFGEQDVLSSIKKANMTYFYDSFTALNLISGGSDSERFKLALDAADSDHVFYLVFNSIPDALGHKFGGDSPETKEGLKKMDRDLKSFVEKFEQKRKDTRFIFVGDHGMVDVEDNFNVEDIILKNAKINNLVLGKDFTYFLDSTLCRIWLHSEIAKNKFADSIMSNEDLNSKGQFIDQALANDLNIPYEDKRYGDIKWWCNPGVMISPDFFHLKDKKLKGMHGYDIHHNHSKGMCIVYGGGQKNKRTDELHLTSINDLIRESLSEQTNFKFD